MGDIKPNYPSLLEIPFFFQTSLGPLSWFALSPLSKPNLVVKYTAALQARSTAYQPSHLL